MPDIRGCYLKIEKQRCYAGEILRQVFAMYPAYLSTLFICDIQLNMLYFPLNLYGYVHERVPRLVPVYNNLCKILVNNWTVQVKLEISYMIRFEVSGKIRGFSGYLLFVSVRARCICIIGFWYKIGMISVSGCS